MREGKSEEEWKIQRRDPDIGKSLPKSWRVHLVHGVNNEVTLKTQGWIT